MKEKTSITIGIFGNIQKEEVSKLLNEIAGHLINCRINFLASDELVKMSSPKLKKYSATSKEILKKADIILSLGGDGTFLNTSRIVSDKNIPILGVNLGRLGFFSEVGPAEIKSFIPKLISGKFRVTEQVIIKSKVNKYKTLFGLNDVVIDKSDSIRMIETETIYNNEKVVRCVSDGIIISTPAGSTGYSLSCNGPIVNPESKVFIITPISPHTLNVRPIIVPDSGEIKIRIHKIGRARITSDGQSSIQITLPAEVVISKADYTTKVIKKLNTTYFETLKKKLFWGEDKRKLG